MAESGVSHALVDLLRRRGRMSAAEVLSALGISRATLTRAVAAAPDVIRIGKARATQYTVCRYIRGQAQWPLYRFTASAKVQHVGTLRALAGGEFLLEPGHEVPALMPKPFAEGLYPDLPWFLEDLRPNGFLGRTFAHRMSALLRVPADLKLWNSEHLIVALTEGGSTESGDLVLGDIALQRLLRDIEHPIDGVDIDACAQRYPQMAMDVLKGEPPGSSPGGEQAKFTATVRTAQGQYEALVKFSAGDGSPGARRWSSLLRCEALASQALAGHGIAACESRILESDGQVFLEVRRFDRSESGGRIGFVSLAALDAAFYGNARAPWWELADALERDGWIAAEDAVAMRRVSWFGALIANSDMHLGNFGLVLGDEKPLRSAPVYDMLPMLLQPTSQGLLVQREFTPPLPPAGQQAPWRWAAQAAVQFWQAVVGDETIEADVREFAVQAQGKIQRVMSRFA